MIHSPVRQFLRLLAICLALSVAGCKSRPPVDAPPPEPALEPVAYQQPEHHLGIQDFGDPNSQRLAARWHALQASPPTGEPLRVLQLGDSHTASDTFTSGLRERLQQQLGNAGIGWIPPMNIRGQSHRLVKLSSHQWQLSSSRSARHAHYPMGGYIATPRHSGAQLRVEARQPDAAMQRAAFLIRQPAGGAAVVLQDATGRRTPLRTARTDAWEYVEADVRLPFTLTASQADAVQLGGIWLTRPDQSGALVSPIGSNGARLENWQQWSPAWTSQLNHSQADLLILAYGTNEAFDHALQPAAMAEHLAQSIRLIRTHLPEAVVLILAAADAMMAATDPELPCAQRRPPMLAAVKQVQLAVAQQERTLYWDWQSAMGGACPMLEWQTQGWAGKDLVHFTAAGYQESALRFHADLTSFLGRH